MACNKSESSTFLLLKVTAMFATSANRVLDNTPDSVNDKISRETDVRLIFFARYPEKIDQRLRELDKEWDVERMLETGSSSLTLSGLILAKTLSRKWLLLSLGVQGFFMMHALYGWCPPLPVLRRLGFRTPDEINRERFALIVLRESDSKNMHSKKDPSQHESNGRLRKH